MTLLSSLQSLISVPSSLPIALLESQIQAGDPGTPQEAWGSLNTWSPLEKASSPCDPFNAAKSTPAPQIAV